MIEPNSGSPQDSGPLGTPQPVSRQPRWMTLAKWLIAIVVLLGLVLTLQSAARQWTNQTEAAEKRLVEIDSSLRNLEPGSIGHRELSRERERVQAGQPSLANLRWSLIGFAAIAYAIGITCNSWVLRRALITLGYRVPWNVVWAAQLLGHVGKYVPGKAMVLVLRLGALAPFGVGTIPASISVVVETLMMLAAGSAIATTVVFSLSLPPWICWSAVLLAVGATVPTLPPVLGRLVSRLVKVPVSLGGKSGWVLLASGWGWSLLAWLFIGMSFAAVIESIPHFEPLPSTAKLVWLATAAIGLAFSIGFVSLLPGGAGIRELVLMTTLAPSIGMPHALAASILLRVLFLAVESLLALLASRWLVRLARSRERQVPDTPGPN